MRMLVPRVDVFDPGTLNRRFSRDVHDGRLRKDGAGKMLEICKLRIYAAARYKDFRHALFNRRVARESFLFHSCHEQVRYRERS